MMGNGIIQGGHFGGMVSLPCIGFGRRYPRFRVTGIFRINRAKLLNRLIIPAQPDQYDPQSKTGSIIGGVSSNRLTKHVACAVRHTRIQKRKCLSGQRIHQKSGPRQNMVNRKSIICGDHCLQ